jgi:hypothetical protein
MCRRMLLPGPEPMSAILLEPTTGRAIGDDTKTVTHSEVNV